jgi:hypothetical protein
LVEDNEYRARIAREFWKVSEILSDGEYPNKFEQRLQMSSKERSMFYSITNDKLLHFLFYFCAV